MTLVQSFPSHGILHTDIRSANILITDSVPCRAVLLDSVNAQLRSASDMDENWEERARMEDEVEGLRRILDNRGVREKSPSRPDSWFDIRTGTVEYEAYN